MQRDAIEIYESIIAAEENFHEFVKQAWPIVEGGKPFIDNWHIQAICEHLELTATRQIRKLLINVPPRTSKSTIISVAFPAWLWVHAPHEQFMYASYAAHLSHELSNKCRMLIESPWYQKRWGHLYQIAKDQNAKSFFRNTKLGYRIATSVDGSSTGMGGNFLFFDDINNAKDGESQAERENTNNFWSWVWNSRLNDPMRDVFINVQQRLHEMDNSGFIMSHDDDNEWVKLILPMEFEERRRARTVVLTSTNGKVWEDPRTYEGELLCPERFGPKEIATYKKEMGSYGYAGQYQQRPAPSAGGIIKEAWWQLWKEFSPPKIVHVIQSWDTALEAGDKNAYSACTTWGLFYRNHQVADVILLSLWQGKVEYPELRETAQRLYRNYLATDPRVLNKSVSRPDMVLVEAKASGAPLVQELMRAGIPAFRFNPNRYGDKEERVRLITPFLESGKVWVPAKPPHFKEPRSWAQLLIDQCSTFPNSDYRDLVDTMTQALIRLRDGGLLYHPLDDHSTDTSVRKRDYTFEELYS